MNDTKNTPESVPPRRGIRSFVLRTGRTASSNSTPCPFEPLTELRIVPSARICWNAMPSKSVRK